MEYAKPIQRISSFWLDTLLLVSIFLILGRIFWYFVPGSEIRADAMQLYTEKDFNNFFVTAGVGFIFMIWYNVYLPTTKLESTWGQKIFKIKMAQTNGQKLNLKTSALRALLITIKFIIPVLAGPYLAHFGNNQATSIFALFFPTLMIILLSVKAWLNPNGIGPVESFGKYIYLKR